MRRGLHPWKWLAYLGLAFVMAGCAREDGSRIIGHWRAERFEMMSLKVPIGPELTISRDTLVAGSEVAVPIAAISQDGSEITLDLPMSFGLTFNLVEDDRMYVDLPLVDRIYYRRVPQGTQPVLTPVAAAAPAPAPAPVVALKTAPVVANAAPISLPVSGVYANALEAVRHGDHDMAVRLLHRAFEEGGVRPAEVQAAPEWFALRDDVRFQVLVARYEGK